MTQQTPDGPPMATAQFSIAGDHWRFEGRATVPVGPPSGHVRERWVPLILAPPWVEAHPEEPPPRPGTELLEEFLRHLSVKGESPEAE